MKAKDVIDIVKKLPEWERKVISRYFFRYTRKFGYAKSIKRNEAWVFMNESPIGDIQKMSLPISKDDIGLANKPAVKEFVPKRMNFQDAKVVSERVFAEHAELFCKLAQ